MSGRPLLNARPLGDPAQVDALIARAVEGQEADHHLRQRRDLVAGVGRDAGSSSRRPASPSTRRRRAAAWCPTITRCRSSPMRSTAFKDADLIIVLGTRMNYIIGHAAPPRFNADATIARIDIDADEIATAARKVDIGIVGDCKAVLQPAARRHARARSTRTASRPGARRWPTARRRSARQPGANKYDGGRRHPSAAAVRGDQELHASATPSWWWTGRRSSTTAASRCRPSRPATG